MFAVTAAQMREIDRTGCALVGGIRLMERAAEALCAEILSRYGRSAAVSAVCGGGNNGGDGLYAAVLLKEAGCRVQICLCGEPRTEDAKEMYSRAKAAGIPFSEELGRPDVIVDALVGTGFHGTLRERAAYWVDRINESGAAVVAADCPTGINSDDGSCEKAVCAEVTVTFHRPKPGLYSYPGRALCGEIVVADIGMPGEAEQNIRFETEIAGRDSALMMLPPRRADSNKGNFGTAVIAGGSQGMCGSITLAAAGALRAGAGKALVAAPEETLPVLAVKLTEAMQTPLRTAEELLSLPASVLALGCGLRTGEWQRELVVEVIERAKVPLILDADALNCIAAAPEVFKRAKAPVLLTPHPGEMARLCGITAEEVQRNRFALAKEFAARYGVTVLLKGAGSITAAPDGRACLNTSGGPALAKGGSGDLLCGMAAGFAAQGMPLFTSAARAAYYHGLAGDRVAQRYGSYAVLATDVAAELPCVLRAAEMEWTV